MSEFVTPLARIVEGSCFVRNDKGYQGKALGNHADGTPKLVSYLAVALNKQDPEVKPFMQKMVQFTREAFPQLPANYNPFNPGFSSKMFDGDHPDLVNKPGFAGHYILKCSTYFETTVIAACTTRIITNPDEVKCGYYVQVKGEYQTNGLPLNDSNVGMKCYQNKVLFRYAGDVIVTSDNSIDAFKGTGTFMPPGAREVGQPATGQQPQQVQPVQHNANFAAGPSSQNTGGSEFFQQPQPADSFYDDIPL